MGHVGRIAVFDDRCGRVSQCHTHFDVRRRAIEAFNRQGVGVLVGDGGQRAPAVSRAGAAGTRAAQEQRTPFASHARIPLCTATGRPDGAAESWIRLQRVVGSPAQRTLETPDEDQLQRRSAAGHPPRRRFFVPASQAHDAWQAGRSGVRQGPAGTQTLEKGALAKASDAVLIFQDEMEIHRHPALTRMWAPVAQQPEVPAPGKNEKQVVYGGVNYRTGKFTYTLATTKCGAAFLVFLMVLVKQYVGKKILLVCDNGRFYKTAAVLEWLAAHRH